jgi:glycerol transport system ATP-binding protein
VVEDMVGTTRVAAITHGALPGQGDIVHLCFDPARTRAYRDGWIATTAGGAA